MRQPTPHPRRKSVLMRVALMELRDHRKIENFIRTKYEAKKWVMDGPMPDPSTLSVDGDDDVVKNPRNVSGTS